MEKYLQDHKEEAKHLAPSWFCQSRDFSLNKVCMKTFKVKINSV